MKTPILKFNLARINSVSKVIQTLERLEDQLVDTKLANLKAFNKAYLIITKNVYQKAQEGYFTDHQTLLKLDIVFAQQYFRALRDYLNKKEVPKAWQISFDYCTENRSPQLIYLALGANAHINGDLANSLLQTVKSSDFKVDYQKMQQVIDLSIKEIIPSLVYSIIAKILLRRWRSAAWRNYLKLRAEEITQENVNQEGRLIARRILYFGKINL